MKQSASLSPLAKKGVEGGSDLGTSKKQDSADEWNVGDGMLPLGKPERTPLPRDLRTSATTLTWGREPRQGGNLISRKYSEKQKGLKPLNFDVGSALAFGKLLKESARKAH